MLKLFQKWDRVKEVFISKRLNRRDIRFEFVRFFDVGNVVILERELDRCYIGNMKLHVNLPRYRREGFERKGDVLNKAEKTRSGGGGLSHVQRKSKEVWREKRGKDVIRNDNVKHSYSDAIRRSTKDQWRGPSITTKAHILPWMTNSMVSCMLSELNFE